MKSLFLALLLLARPLAAQQAVTATWDTMATATGYTLSYGTQSHQYTTTASTTAPTWSATLQPGTYFFAVQALNSFGASAYSAEVAFTVQGTVTGSPLVAHLAHASSHTQGFTTAPLNTTGATLLVAHVSDGDGSSQVSDSLGNAWKRAAGPFGLGPVSTIWTVATPAVGVAQTFTVTSAGKAPSLEIAAFNVTTVAVDQTNGGRSLDGTTLQPGSVTPTVGNALILTGAAYGGMNALAVDSGFAISDQLPNQPGATYGGGLAWLVQPVASAINPTWSDGGAGAFLGASIVTLMPSTVSTPAPILTSLIPTSGLAGSSVTITGSNFVATQGASALTFNGVLATVTSWSATSIVTTVPAAATSGPVVMTVGGQSSNGLSYTVTATVCQNVVRVNGVQEFIDQPASFCAGAHQ